MGGLLIEEDLLVGHNIIDRNTPEGQKIHNFLLNRAKLLVGNTIDFKKTPITFVMSDLAAPNAFFMPVTKEVRKRSSYNNTRTYINPYDTPVICVTKGLIDMVDNLDQLDYVLGHELTHNILRDSGVGHNSKGEEEIADLHSIDLVYDAGGDPKQALAFSRKIKEYKKEQKEKDKKKKNHGSYSTEEAEGIKWSEILDVHMTDENRESAIEASLTRLSHLIDERNPTELDKSVFDTKYSDPVDAFLEVRDYKNKEAVEKLKILVDTVEQMSSPAAHAKIFFNAQLEALPKQGSENYDHWAEYNKEIILRNFKDNNYYVGKTLEKKYQQKIAKLAEGVVADVEKEYEHKTTVAGAKNLKSYLLDAAYKHIQENGYPKSSDVNYLDASGVMYTYFYHLFGESFNSEIRKKHGIYNRKLVPQIVLDIENTKKKIYEAKEVTEFLGAAEEFKNIKGIYKELKSISYDVTGKKFNNLSFIDQYYTKDDDKLFSAYSEISKGGYVPWNNLVEIAKNDNSAKEHVNNFLVENLIEDFRISKNEPYLRISNFNLFKLNGNGKVISNTVSDDVFDYAVNKDKVLAAYGYIKNYFNDEEELVDDVCKNVLNLEEINDTSKGLQKPYDKVNDFVSLYNSFPAEGRSNEQREHEKSVFFFIADKYFEGYFLQSKNKKDRLEISRSLFLFENKIFQEHFGKKFDNWIIEQKTEHKHKMFDVALKTVKMAEHRYVDAFNNKSVLEKDLHKLWKEEKTLKGKLKYKNKEEQKKLSERISLYNERVELYDTTLHNLLHSVFESDNSRYHIKVLTSEQKKTLADCVVRDERGVFKKLFVPNRYMGFCDYSNVLAEQVDGVISGNYKLTEAMQSVAKNLGYVPIETIAGLENVGDREDNYKYIDYLNMFGIMQHLENSPNVNLLKLSRAMLNIEYHECDENSERKEYSLGTEAKSYSTYKKFVKESRMISLVSKALNSKENYDALTPDEKMTTADNLISLKEKMTGILAISKKYATDRSGAYEITLESGHKDFLELLDEKITGVFKDVYNQALNNRDALEKTRILYSLYNFETDYGKANRWYCLGRLDGMGNSRQELAILSSKPDFWPEDTLDHVKSFVFAKKTFLDDVEFENGLLNNILDKLEKTPAGVKKDECFSILLDKNLRAAFPETREKLFDLYVNDVAAQIGKDDGSEKYREKLEVYLKALANENRKDWDIGRDHGQRNGMLSNSIAVADKYVLLRQLSDTLVSQEETSSIIKKASQVQLDNEDLLKSYLYGIGIDYLTSRLDDDPDTAKKFIQFFNSRGEANDCGDISKHLQDIIQEKSNGMNTKHLLDKTQPSKCKILYENFWSAPLEARAVVTSRTLKSAVNEEDNSNVQRSWEKVFDLVMNNMISPDDVSIESKYARDIMHSYIKARSDYERELIMSAMMVANRNIGKDAGNVGKALKLFLENMGPAEIKLGQAVSSHPQTPEDIKKEMQDLKNEASKPARWEMYEWIKNENIPQKLWKGEYLGEILGSASYYTTIALGEDKVLRILRPEAREKAVKGFRVLADTVEDLKEKDNGVSGLDYKELTASVTEMVQQADRMSVIETDHQLGQKQYEYAQKIYNGIKIKSGSEKFSFKVMDWRVKGENWIVMDRAEGYTFNSLPTETPEQIEYKRTFAKAYIALEIRNIISGGRFDHDRHGAQLCINPETNKVGIFDTGAMALELPTPHEQELLGGMIYDLFIAKNKGKTFSDLGGILSNKIEELHKQDVDTKYFVEVQKGVLALGDFFNVLQEKDIKEIFIMSNFPSVISDHVRAGIASKMSYQEQYEFVTDTFNKLSGSGVEGNITDEKAVVKSKVINVSVLPNKEDKSGWLQEIFSDFSSKKIRTDKKRFVNRLMARNKFKRIA